MSQNANETFAVLLRNFAQAIDIPELELDETFACALEVDELLFNLQWLPEAESLLIYAPIGTPDKGANALGFCEFLLEANCLGRDTGGFTLGLRSEQDSVVLSGRILLSHLDAQSLYDFVERFAEQGKNWQQRLREGAYAAPKDLPEAGFDVTGGLRV
jgi:hypothetical protein